MNTPHPLDSNVFIAHQSRVVVRGVYGEPETPAFALRLLTDKFWKSAQAKKAVMNLRRYDLRKLDKDDLEDKTPRAIGLDYTPYFQDKFNRLDDWAAVITVEERKFREGRLKELQDKQTDLKEKLEKEEAESKKKELQTELNGIEGEIRRLQLGGPGYLEEVPDAFGDGVCGLYDPLNEPYVPRQRLSQFLVASGSPFCARCYFWKPDEEQSDWEFYLEWHVYRLVFSIDRVQLIRLNEHFSIEEMEEKELELKALLDRGRITRDDTLWKAAQKRKIADIKKKAKADGRESEDKMTEDERTAIKKLEKEIDDRWESKKRRTGAEEKQIEDLKQELYQETRTVEFGQNFETFFNTPLVLTFIPQARGYLTIQLEGAESWTFEEKEITKKREPGMMWPDCRTRHGLNGGAYKFQIGVPDPKALGILDIAPIDAGFDLTDQAFEITGYWEGENLFDENDQPLILFELVLDRTAMQTQPARVWKMQASLTPGPIPVAPLGKRLLSARYFPFIYDANLFIAAGERTGSDAVIWDSKDHLTSIGVAPVVDIKPCWDERGARSYTVTLRHMRLSEDDSEGELGDIPDLDGHIADLYIDDCEDGDVPVLARGIIGNVTIEKTMSAGTTLEPSPETQITFTLRDRYAVLDDGMQARPVGDDDDLGAYFSTVLQCRGERDDELAIDEVGIDLPVAPPGEDPAVIPAVDTTYSSFLLHLLELHGLVPTGVAGGGLLRLKWRSDADGGFWLLEPDATTLAQIDEEEVHFHSDSYDTRYFLRESVDLPDDDSEIYNVFPIEGAKDPDTKETLKYTHVVWESIRKADDLRFIGRMRPHKTIRDESLKTKEDLLRFARSLASLKCRSKKFRRIKTAFIPALMPFDQVTADGVRVELTKLDGGSAAEDEMEFVARRLS